jgi:putative colanic acid biosynthesis acetyltransferase WcaF
VIYNIDEITIGDDAIVSQHAYLCAGTHGARDISFPIRASPITIESECWIAARAFVGPGVRIGLGASRRLQLSQASRREHSNSSRDGPSGQG